MPITVRVRPRTPQEREAVRFNQLRFGRYTPPEQPRSSPRETRASRESVPLIPALRDLVAGIRRQTSPFTVAPTWVRTPQPATPSDVRQVHAPSVVETPVIEAPRPSARRPLMLIHK
jgi:hypothetical protein